MCPRIPGEELELWCPRRQNCYDTRPDDGLGFSKLLVCDIVGIMDGFGPSSTLITKTMALIGFHPHVTAPKPHLYVDDVFNILQMIPDFCDCEIGSAFIPRLLVFIFRSQNAEGWCRKRHGTRMNMWLSRGDTRLNLTLVHSGLCH